MHSADDRCCVLQVILKQNLCLALGSIVALALPVLCGWIPLWIAVTLHEGSTLLVALNSLRLLHWKDTLAADDPLAGTAGAQQQELELDASSGKGDFGYQEQQLAQASVAA